MQYINEFKQFMDESHSSFHAIKNIEKHLVANGYQKLWERDVYNLQLGGKYYVLRNNTSVIAFNIPNKLENYYFSICASHSDSPTFKIKPKCVLKRKNYLMLNTEGYGVMLCSTWFDKPLSFAGRVFIKEEDKIVSKLLYIDKPTCLIPNVAIHQNRDANSGFAYNKQIDLLPLMGISDDDFSFENYLAQHLNVEEEAVLSYDLTLTPYDKAYTWGLNDEFITSKFIDDLECAYTSLKAFIQADNAQHINVYCCFDNEEVGSSTRQGANSTFLDETLRRINESLNKSEQELCAAIARSFMVSCDNAHAIHPNHMEKYDELNHCFMNKGIVIKTNAAQSYTTDGMSSAIFKMICEKCHVPYQTFTNRSDMAGGGTLGNISNAHVSLVSVDIGLAQLAMHSSMETAGTKDIQYMITALTKFYNSELNIDNDMIMVD